MEQNIAQQDKSIDNQLPSNSGGGKNRKILVGIAVVVLLLLIVIAIRSSVILVNKKSPSVGRKSFYILSSKN